MHSLCTCCRSSIVKMLVYLTVVVVMLLVSTCSSDEHKINKRSAVGCFDDLGCFNTDAPYSSPPRINALVPLPESPFFMMTKYYLYTKQNSEIKQTLAATLLDSMALAWTRLKSVSTKIIVHGYIDDPKLFADWMRKMKDEFLIHGDHNVIIVDWSMGNKPPYIQAAANTRVVGAQIAKLIEKISNLKGLTPGDFHIIGHSLGSHIAGYAGERLEGRLGRITGLDPAGPEFQGTHTLVRLDPSDAVLVDNIHTDGKSILTLGFGTQQAMGHMDFYPNEGLNQPGCSRSLVKNFLEKGIVEGLSDVVACSHRRAIFLFIESINSECQFYSVPCKSYLDFKDNKCNTCSHQDCASMGLPAAQNKPAAGEKSLYYVRTSDSPPFCVNVDTGYSGGGLVLIEDLVDLFNITNIDFGGEVPQLDAECKVIIERILTEKHFSN